MRTLAALALALVLAALVGCAPSREPALGESINVKSAPAPDTPDTKPVPTSDDGAREQTKGITWFTSLKEAKKRGQLLDRPILIDFYADWCGPCRMLDDQTWPDPSVAKAASNFICVKINIDENAETARDFKVTSIPAIFVINAQGRILGDAIGFRSPQQMVDFLSHVK